MLLREHTATPTLLRDLAGSRSVLRARVPPNSSALSETLLEELVCIMRRSATAVNIAAALVALGHEQHDAKPSNGASSRAACALLRFVGAVACAVRDHRALWDACLEDPVGGRIAEVAADARVTTRAAECALEALLAMIPAVQRPGAAGESEFRGGLSLAQWLDVFECQLVLERRAVRSPKQLYQLAAMTRVAAVARAEKILQSAHWDEPAL